MRVALDATPLSTPTGGIRRYVHELYRALSQCFPEDDYQLVSDQPFPGRTAPLPSSWFERRWWLIGVQREMRRLRCELFHGADFAVPYLPLNPSVITIHDLSPWREDSQNDTASRVRRRTPWLLRLGIPTMVLTPTEAIRREVINCFRLKRERVVAVPLAAPPHLRRTSTRPGNYFLFVGTLTHRKNLFTLLEAWRLLREHAAVDLVVAGRQIPGGCVLPPEQGLHVLGAVEETQLADLYSGAIAFVYPSLYEGFGLPVLEAMQCGAAVLASRDAALCEVTGGAAVHIDATDVRAWTAAMLKVATDTDWREDLRRRSLARAAAFSWKRTARLTHEVYREALDRFGR